MDKAHCLVSFFTIYTGWPGRQKKEVGGVISITPWFVMSGGKYCRGAEMEGIDTITVL